ncbi:hypothetical protein BKA59DRAFT_471277 [Fusarium tricinctum]|uniref:N-acetyltransferase domain-containing protein n=1 Tax=Fusarium tricinctum TaxID=61284 RepID=A0A8K0WGZ8_9HYPO|nr:hypothetical protein BKA59DRAFT_471277 [Fusarium tricinctum]
MNRLGQNMTTQVIRKEGNTHVVNLSRVGIPLEEAKVASEWIAKAFAQAPAEPALAIFFGPASYEENREMHEAFWASHLGRVAKSGVLLGALNSEGWQGFRCLFPPGQGWQPYSVEYDTGIDNTWERFLELTGKEAYMNRVQEWGRLTGKTHKELDLTVDQFFTTSMIVVNPSNQRQGIGRLLDEAAREIVHSHGTKLFVRIHEHILSFYLKQGYRVLASETFTLGEVKPFLVHFLIHDCLTS